ncbi:MAG: methylthioribulose 1-phosphate dehydratase [Alphaproteobacteria bacterium]|nr:methylthioribulose 1-phosphate dehydratase [Alphaproteobacteria bacterium]
MVFTFEKAAQEIIAAGNRLDKLGLAPATSGNYSMRLNDGTIALTVSGAHKGMLTPADIMRVDLNGNPLEDKKPSAETLLHTGLYKRYPETNAILHAHSIPCVVLTRSRPEQKEITLEGYEMLKAFPGVETHETSINVPIFDNTQDIARLSEDVDQILAQKKNAALYLIRAHGFYSWGKDMKEVLRITEAAEVLLACEMNSTRYQPMLEKAS